MADPAQALATQLANIEKRTGRSLRQLAEIVRRSGLAKHGELRDMLKRDLGMGHGDANTLVHHVLNAAGSGAEPDAQSMDRVIAGLYAGPKATLRPIHDKLMAAIDKFGDFDIAPKKTYVSLRRRKQFAMIGPATRTRVEVGLNITGAAATERLVALPPGNMCNYKVNVASPDEVDDRLVDWIRKAFDGAA